MLPLTGSNTVLKEAEMLKNLNLAFFLLIAKVYSEPITVLNWNFDDPDYKYEGVYVEASHSGLIQTQGYSGMGITDVRFGGRMMWGGWGAMHFDVHNLPEHNLVDINFLLAVMDSWDGQPPNGCCNPDYLNVEIMNLEDTTQRQVVFTNSFNNVFGYQPGYDGPDAQGYSRSLGNQIAAPTKNLAITERWNDAAYDMYLDPNLSDIYNNWGNIRIMIYNSGEGWQGLLDESFAIDQLNISVDTITPAVPESQSVILVGLGLLFLAISRFRFRTKAKT